MKLFKNEVGRPSNETIKKRRIIVISSIFVFIFLLAGGVFLLTSGSTSELSAGIGNSGLDNFKISYDSKTKKTTVMGCPSGYAIYNNKKCVKDIPETHMVKTLLYSTANKKCKKLGYTGADKKKIRVRDPGKVPTTYYACKSRAETNINILNIPYYNQGDYSDYSRCGGGNLPKKGCNPTSAAMIFSALLGKTLTPSDMNNTAKNYSDVCSGNSYTVNFLKKYAANNNIHPETVDGGDDNNKKKPSKKTQVNYIYNKLKTGKCVGAVALKAGCKLDSCYSNAGHFMMFYVSETSGYAYYNDPGHRNLVKKKTTIQSILDASQSYHIELFCRK